MFPSEIICFEIKFRENLHSEISTEVINLSIAHLLGHERLSGLAVPAVTLRSHLFVWILSFLFLLRNLK